ncbi:MAG: Regulatory LuxR family protein [Gammaproteobacteria bacterium]|jgi:LuxR family maltose regulon positive regulatory protein|nr:Regulatory LuxR family protein [Gammaproteobacteria bacterium]
MTGHGIPVGIQDTEGCVTDPPLRSEINVPDSAFCLWDDDASPYSPRHANWAPERRVNEVLLLGEVRRNLTGADSGQIRRDVRRARRLMLKWHLSEGFELIDRIERALGDLPSDVARRARAETSVLRAIGVALQDDSLSALYIALRVLRDDDISPHARTAALAVCRFAYWRLRDFDSLHCLPRHPPTVVLARRDAMSAVLNLCVEAAVELEQLRLSAAKMLALDALEMARTVCGPDTGLAALPASIVAQVLYEQGSLYEAEACIRGRLRVINAFGVLECASRAYLVLARIAMHQGRDVFAASILQEAEELGERRGWARLIAMSMGQRVDLLLRQGRITEAQLGAERLDQLAAQYPTRADGADPGVQSYRRIAYARLALASVAAADTVAILRQLHHDAVGRHDLYSAVRLAVQLAASLDLTGEPDEADSLFLRALSLGRFAGLYQAFVDGGGEIDPLLVRAYDHTHRPGAAFRELLPYIGSLVALDKARSSRRYAARATMRSSEGLSVRERDILILVGRGLSNKRIARALTIAPETVKSHVKRIFLKLEVKTRAQAVARAGAQGHIQTGGSWLQTS